MADTHDLPHDLDIEAFILGLEVDFLDVAADTALFFLQPLDPLDKRFETIASDSAYVRHFTVLKKRPAGAG
jgi:hypothetical protein